MSGLGWRMAYRAASPLMALGLRAAAAFDAKARAAYHGRKGWETSLAEQLQERRLPAPAPRWWLHAASAGEFEQAKPLLERLYPTAECVVSCFSPSVYDPVRRFPYQDAAAYLPIDTRRNARRFLDIVRPSAAVFSKFDVWPNCVWEASRRGIPCALIAGTLHAGSRRLRPWSRGLFRSAYRELRLQCAVTEEDASRLRRLSGDGPRIVATGDTRYDQVYARSRRPAGGPPMRWGWTLIAGSVYAEDESALIPAFARLKAQFPECGLCAAPHEPTERNLRGLEERLKAHGLTSKRLSEVGRRWNSADAVAVDSVGLLAGLYRFGDAAFVGGSFRSRVHNVMEPAVYGKPVLFGPKISNAPEAAALLRAGAALLAPDEAALSAALIRLAQDRKAADEAGRRGKAFIMSNLGASERTWAELSPLLGAAPITEESEETAKNAAKNAAEEAAS